MTYYLFLDGSVQMHQTPRLNLYSRPSLRAEGRAQGVEEEARGCLWRQGPGPNQARLLDGYSVWFAAVGAQVYSQLLLWVCDEEGRQMVLHGNGKFFISFIFRDLLDFIRSWEDGRGIFYQIFISKPPKSMHFKNQLIEICKMMWYFCSKKSYFFEKIYQKSSNRNYWKNWN